MSELAPPRTRIDRVAAVLHPTSLAIVGARDDPGTWPNRIRDNLARFGWAGPVHGVNPRRDTVWGQRCYPDVASIPDAPDQLLMLLPARPTLEVLRTAADVGVRSATLFTSGFDADQLRELQQIADVTGLAISGPNCLGNISVPSSLVATTDSRLDAMKDGPVAVVGQSGGVISAVNRTLVGRGIGARYAISSGNETCLTTADYLSYFASDDGVRVVLAFVESVRDWPAFAAAAHELHERGKHVVAVKVGQSAASQQAAASHTGALAGSFAAFEAAAGALGVVTVADLDVAVEVCELLARVPSSPMRGVGFVTVSGGVREMVLDAAGRHEVALPALHTSTRATIAESISEGEVANPLDSGWAGLSSSETLARFVALMADDPNIDTIMLQEELLGRPDPGKERTLATFQAAFPDGRVPGTEVPVALFSIASHAVTDHGRELHDRYCALAFLQGIDKTLAALAAVGRAHRSANRRDSSHSSLPDRAEPLRQRLSAGRPLNEVEAKEVLREYGIDTPVEVFLTDPNRAASATAGMQEPFVVKIVDRTASHKSDIGGVIIGVAARDLDAVCRDLLARLPSAEGVLVVEQVPTERVEVVVGVSRDPEVGPVVMIGSGGVGVELFSDVAFVPVPCSIDQARAALLSTKAARQLGAWRGRESCDVDALVAVICAMSDLALDAGKQLQAAEINPVAVFPGRPGALALDALLVPGSPE